MNFAFVFPGQGSQHVGMCAALRNDYPAVEHLFVEANEILGYDIGAVMAAGPAEQLNATETTQPAMLVASVATWEAWRASGGPLPHFMAGHSFGEYSALVCAGAISYHDALGLAAARGRYMQEAVPAELSAVRAVLGLEEDVLSALCAQAASDQVVQCANLNAPGQIVITGDLQAVERACALATEAGAKKIVPLAVSAPVHCALMLPAAERFAERLAEIDIQRPQVPVIHNVDARARDDVAGIRQALIEQMARPVRWQDTVEFFVDAGVGLTIECGPGKVLSALVRRTARALKTSTIADLHSIENLLDELSEDSADTVSGDDA